MHGLTWGLAGAAGGLAFAVGLGRPRLIPPRRPGRTGGGHDGCGRVRRGGCVLLPPGRDRRARLGDLALATGGLALDHRRDRLVRHPRIPHAEPARGTRAEAEEVAASPIMTAGRAAREPRRRRQDDFAGRRRPTASRRARAVAASGSLGNWRRAVHKSRRHRPTARAARRPSPPPAAGGLPSGGVIEDVNAEEFATGPRAAGPRGRTSRRASTGPARPARRPAARSITAWNDSGPLPSGPSP